VQAEPARATLLELCPLGFEEYESVEGLELTAYVDAAGEAALRRAFRHVVASDLAPGWEEAWRRFHRPVRVGRFWVGPPWERLPRDAVPIVVDPGRAFGTGAHPTTRLCLGLLLEHEPTSLLDVGCGSGVLAIAAAKIGWAPVIALDREEASIEATRSNALVNAVDVDVRLADALEDPLPATELVVANIDLSSVEALAARVSAPRLLASGYLAADRIEAAGWRRRTRRELDGWAADVFERP
jgi:ribosomal protein L11 methyltransferase